ncbi:MAG TPA: hypothetical protein VGK31_06860 [Thermoanaerobaculia bacterium]
MLRAALSFIAGAAVAVAIWWYATPAYNVLLSRIVGHAEASDRAIKVSRPDAPQIQIPADELTYNIILFAGLAAAVPPRRIERLLAAIVVLLGFHVLALLAAIEATYATRAGAWSTAHYSALAQDFWNSVNFIYRIGGMFAIAFVCWYAAIGARGPQPGTSKKPVRAGQDRPRAAKSRR